MKLELTGAMGRGSLGVIELGEPGTEIANYRYFSGDTNGGNVYLHLDGVEYGSLFVCVVDGRPQISLGQYDAGDGEWVDRNPLTESVDAPTAIRNEEDIARLERQARHFDQQAQRLSERAEALHQSIAHLHTRRAAAEREAQRHRDGARDLRTSTAREAANA